MRHSRSVQKMIASLVAVTFCFLSVVVAPVQSAIVGTSDILSARHDDLAREKVVLFLERQDVAKQLQAMGVSMEEAQARVDAMTAEEIDLLARKIDHMPAGGDFGFVVGVAVVAFVVLIILDIVGVTDIFTFIKKR